MILLRSPKNIKYISIKNKINSGLNLSLRFTYTLVFKQISEELIQCVPNDLGLLPIKQSPPILLLLNLEISFNRY